jgi:hypothetical protein
MFIFSIIFRLFWSLTIGIPIFLVGLVLFLLFDILSPKSDRGYRILNSMYKWGSCYWFKGLRMEKDEFEINVTKNRREGE